MGAVPAGAARAGPALWTRRHPPGAGARAPGRVSTRDLTRRLIGLASRCPTGPSTGDGSPPWRGMPAGSRGSRPTGSSGRSASSRRARGAAPARVVLEPVAGDSLRCQRGRPRRPSRRTSVPHLRSGLPSPGLREPRGCGPVFGGRAPVCPAAVESSGSLRQWSQSAHGARALRTGSRRDGARPLLPSGPPGHGRRLTDARGRGSR